MQGPKEVRSWVKFQHLTPYFLSAPDSAIIVTILSKVNLIAGGRCLLQSSLSAASSVQSNLMASMQSTLVWCPKGYQSPAGFW